MPREKESARKNSHPRKTTISPASRTSNDTRAVKSSTPRTPSTSMTSRSKNEWEPGPGWRYLDGLKSFAVLPEDVKAKGRDEAAMGEVGIMSPLEGEVIKDGMVKPGEQDEERRALKTDQPDNK